jgi:hypothetical protein
MAGNLEAELDRIKTLGLAALRKHWTKRIGGPPPPWRSADLLRRTLAFRLQEREYSGLDKYAMRRLRSLARALESEGELPLTLDLSIKPGAKLIREWHGKTYTVTALEEGFEFKGRRFRSLSGIAREITGARWSGMRFFGLTKNSKHTCQEKGEAL